MRKHFPHISTFLLTLTLVFVVGIAVFTPYRVSAAIDVPAEFGCYRNSDNVYLPVPNEAACPKDATWKLAPAAQTQGASVGGDSWLMKYVLVPGSLGILKLVSLLTALAGKVLNGVIYYTVGQMADNYRDLDAIDTTWTTIRDLANMTFIFILLYAAIKTILGMGSDTKKLIIRVIIVAILINFSLFFTQVVIDASNILAIAFYDAIAPGALAATNLKDALLNPGMSDAFMDAMNLTSLYDISALENVPEMFTIAVMGSIMLLIATFVFFAAAIMFIVRYTVLILVLILSPLALMGFILPGIKSYADKWKDALIGQAFFAPVYFMLVWISLRVLTGVGDSVIGGKPTAKAAFSALGQPQNATNLTISQEPFALFINFIVVIVFLIAALTIAKGMANKAGGAVTSMNKWAGKFAGGASFGVAGFAGRQSVGRLGAALGDSEKFKKMAEKGGLTGMTGRLALATGRKTAGASFDGRGTAIGVELGAGKVQKGGYTQYRKDKDEKKDKFAASLEASVKAKAKSKKEYEEAKKKYKNYPDSLELLKAKQKHDEIHGNKKEVETRRAELESRKSAELQTVDRDNAEKLKEAENSERSAHDTLSRIETEIQAAGAGATDEQKKELLAARDGLKEIENGAHSLRYAIKESKDKIIANYKKQTEDIEIIDTGKVTRRNTYANVIEKSTWAKIAGYNYSGAAKIRAGVKTNKDKIVEAVQALEKESVKGGASTEKTEKEEKPEGENSNKTT
ncbi:MAG: hypothetical protein CO185_00865 [Candidatus Zambryskibacteria bacterium CG_4_9_14_3_um_filter_42_15]|uniref:TrbL/VirB6 plasmid conjugal transfer protein n=1 Tax=Candidatus Zambryskibacteria bacterium CG_4_9_14_3_um_filter_42_15 TaxID=1975112 RepID=A0A2M7WSI1_9BACT|nr:MAG: hypothetical protein CO185_00865 [Candidatus Zambryskibacteria bacterium CG_4_9_14_3_um_filter_42_15]